MFFAIYLPLSNGKSERHAKITAIRFYDVDVYNFVSSKIVLLRPWRGKSEAFAEKMFERL